MTTTNGGFPQRVVITGLGALTPLGHTVEETWRNLVAGRSGIDYITKFDTSDLRVNFAGEVRDFDAGQYMDRKEARRLDPCIQYALVAAQQAIADAGLKLENEDPTRIGVLVGSGIGGIGSFRENVEIVQSKGLRKVSPFMIPNMLVDSPGGKIAIEFNLQGPNHAVVSACASGTTAAGEAFELLRRGDADVVLAGGTEAALLPINIAAFDVMGALSQRTDNPKAACRPFDRDRDGFVMSEGSAILVMETLEHALARGARIYAEVIGYGNTNDAYHMAAPHETGRGAADAMRMALRKAAAYGETPADVDYINAHGTATRLNDVGETLAIKQVFGEGAYNLRISSTKSMTGHLLGAAGALEAIICVKTIETGIVAPTINLDNPDPECDLDYTPNHAVKADVRVTMSNSFGFGGHNACIMLRRYA
ncbi:beta-ketoacyl-ACP synthase II [Caldilinea sp.]|jgi:3-oxoacyl-[acyl-carrier-protein] synthase II|nr:beta-ketoacyl-ACP synthase II [Caldilinea sp.]GIV67310.1 MAG: 3-oxoacyl-[acyl-carrier-protein] synthase 2 [Caldilinea sp.]